MNFLSRFFFSNKGFFTPSKNYIFGFGNQPVLIDTNTPYRIYHENAEVKMCIDKIAKMFSNMEILLVDDEGNEIDNPELNALINKPNPLQGLNSWLEGYIMQKYVYGNTFLYKTQPSKLSYKNTSLWNISPENIEPILTGKLYHQQRVDEIIKEYKLLQGGRKIDTIKTNEILWSKFEDLDNPLIGLSPLKSLRFPISNIKLAYEHRNVIMANKGALGMMTPDNPGDGMGIMPLTPKEREDVDNDYQKTFGVGDGQSRILFSPKPLKWTPISYPTRDLMLFEEVEANKLTIIDYFGLKAELFSTKSNTYENVRQAIRGTYQDVIMPLADQRCQELTSFLGITNGKLVPSFAHVPILQEQKDFKEVVDSINAAVSNGLLDVAVGRAIIEQESQSLNVV
jgi:HK97 family phage portal protein